MENQELDPYQKYMLSTKSLVVEPDYAREFRQRMKDLHENFNYEMERIKTMPKGALRGWCMSLIDNSRNNLSKVK